jgi:hypothetical protein
MIAAKVKIKIAPKITIIQVPQIASTVIGKTGHSARNLAVVELKLVNEV